MNVRFFARRIKIKPTLRVRATLFTPSKRFFSNFNAKTTADEVLATVHVTDKTFVVSGGSAGLGLETVRALTCAGANVISCVRSPEKMLSRVSSAGIDSNRLQVIECRLDDLESVSKCAEEIGKTTDNIQALLLNAGVMFPAGGRNTTVQGFETHFGVNYLGNAYLGGLLTPVLIASAPSRLVFTSAVAMRWGALNFDDLQCEKAYEEFAAYGQSCTARCTFANEYNRRYENQGVLAFSLHPGIISTELQRDFTLEASVKLHLKKPDGSDNPAMKAIQKTPEQGAATQIYGAVSEDESLVSQGGSYLENCQVAKLWNGKVADLTGYTENIYDEAIGQRLFEETEKLLGFQFP